MKQQEKFHTKSVLYEFWSNYFIKMIQLRELMPTTYHTKFKYGEYPL